MPLYTYYCEVCGEPKEIIKSMKDESIPVCCGQNMRRDFKADVPNVGDKEYARPLHSDALAVGPAQVAEHKKLFSDVPLDSQNRPILTSYKQHERYIKTRGFEKLPQKKKRRATGTV